MTEEQTINVVAYNPDAEFTEVSRSVVAARSVQ
jgi:hypothetical protein